ncbi:MAG: hypothetical protein H7841_03975 [Magnetospirillum sp. WYHS-4]
MRARWASFLLGMALPLVVLLAWAPPWRIERDGWDNYYLDTYPWNFRSQPKHLIVGTGCWTWTTEAYMVSGRHETRNSQKATLHAALNAILDEKGGGEERFYGFGRPDVDFERHLISVYQAVRQGDVRSLIYINNPGSLQTFTRPSDTLAALPVLAAIEAEYPRLAEEAKTFRAALLASQGHAQAVVPSATDRLSAWADGVARRWQGLRDSVAFTVWPMQRAHHEARTLFEQVRANYDNPAACQARNRTPMPAGQYWIGAGGEATWQAWLRLAAGLAAEHGVRFVYYVPPHLNLSEARYAAEFRPRFVERIKAVLAAFPNAAVVDHAMGHGLSACDQVYDAEKHFASGYLFNFGGKLKQARILLADLAERRIVAGPASRFLPPARWEAALPSLPMPVAMLSEAESEAVREQLISQAEWRLSLPATGRTP